VNEAKFLGKIFQLTELVGDEQIALWSAVDPIEQAKIAQALAPHTKINCIIHPDTVEKLSAVITWAAEHRWAVLPCGQASKIAWGGLLQPNFQDETENGVIVIQSDRLNRLIDHAVGDLTVTAEAGMQLATLQKILGEKGQFLAIDPAYPEEATLGGIVATGDTGSLRHRYRSVRDMLLGISFVRSDGEIAKAGGRVVKNVAGYDLMKLLTGAYGTLGMISQVTFRVYPLPEASSTVVLGGEEQAIATILKNLLASSLTPVAVDLITPPLMQHLGISKTFGLIVRFMSVAPSVQEQAEKLLAMGEREGLKGNAFYQDDQTIWQTLKEQIWQNNIHNNHTGVICKIGVIPNQAVKICQELATDWAMIHAGSGIGVVRFDQITPERLLTIRQLCQKNHGYLTVLQAPIEFKQNLDVWGYTGNALDLMQKIKQQFDPQQIFNSGRFISNTSV